MMLLSIITSASTIQSQFAGATKPRSPPLLLLCSSDSCDLFLRVLPWAPGVQVTCYVDLLTVLLFLLMVSCTFCFWDLYCSMQWGSHPKTLPSNPSQARRNKNGAQLLVYLGWTWGLNRFEKGFFWGVRMSPGRGNPVIF